MATSEAYESLASCCCCLTNGAELLFEVIVILDEFKCSISDLIAGCCGIIISEQDESSKQICGICLQDLCNTYRFRDCSLQNKEILREKPLHDSGETSVRTSDPESKNKAPSVSCDVADKKPSVSEQERGIQTGNLDKRKKSTKLKRTFTCFTCRDTFLSKRKLKNHVSIHRFPYQCNVCFQRFRQSIDLVLHRETH